MSTYLQEFLASPDSRALVDRILDASAQYRAAVAAKLRSGNLSDARYNQGIVDGITVARETILALREVPNAQEIS